MRFCRFDDNRLGLVEDAAVRDVTGALDVLPSYRYPLPASDMFIAHIDRVAERARAIAGDSPALPLAGLTLRSPVANPTKIIGAPVNYRKHFEEVQADSEIHAGNPVAVIQRAGLFLKANSSLVGPGDGLALRKLDRRCDSRSKFFLHTPANSAYPLQGLRIGIDSGGTFTDFMAAHCCT